MVAFTAIEQKKKRLQRAVRLSGGTIDKLRQNGAFDRPFRKHIKGSTTVHRKPVRRTSIRRNLYAEKPVRRHASSSKNLYVEMPVRRKTCTSKCQFVEKPVRRHASSPTRLYVDMPVHRHASSSTCLFAGLSAGGTSFLKKSS